jgi:hypothetical protein
MQYKPLDDKLQTSSIIRLIKPGELMYNEIVDNIYEWFQVLKG